MSKSEPIAATGNGAFEMWNLYDFDIGEVQLEMEQPRSLELFDPGHEVLVSYDEWDWS